MNWYAIRTKPGAQQPKREYWPEPTESALAGKPRGKGYRMVSSLNPEVSAIETALEAKGFTYYMPAEFAVVRNRHHKGLYEIRRFALMKGYVFVCDPEWSKLLGTPGMNDGIPGVQGVVGNNGNPFPISAMDLFRLRMFEQNLRAVAEAKAASLSTSEERIARNKRKAIVRAARKKFFPGKPVRLIWGDKVGHEATVQSWTDQDQVQVLLQKLDGAGEIITYPHEYLKAG